MRFEDYARSSEKRKGRPSPPLTLSPSRSASYIEASVLLIFVENNIASHRLLRTNDAPGSAPGILSENLLAAAVKGECKSGAAEHADYNFHSTAREQEFVPGR